MPFDPRAHDPAVKRIEAHAAKEREKAEALAASFLSRELDGESLGPIQRWRKDRAFSNALYYNAVLENVRAYREGRSLRDLP